MGGEALKKPTGAAFLTSDRFSGADASDSLRTHDISAGFPYMEQMPQNGNANNASVITYATVANIFIYSQIHFEASVYG